MTDKKPVLHEIAELKTLVTEDLGFDDSREKIDFWFDSYAKPAVSIVDIQEQVNVSETD